MIVTGSRAARSRPATPGAPVCGAVAATRWVLDPAAGTAAERPLDDLVTDFPAINDDLTGRPSPVSYSVAFRGAGLDEFAIVKLDTAAGERIMHREGWR